MAHKNSICSWSNIDRFEFIFTFVVSLHKLNATKAIECASFMVTWIYLRGEFEPSMDYHFNCTHAHRPKALSIVEFNLHTFFSSQDPFVSLVIKDCLCQRFTNEIRICSQPQFTHGWLYCVDDSPFPKTTFRSIHERTSPLSFHYSSSDGHDRLLSDTLNWFSFFLSLI